MEPLHLYSDGRVLRLSEQGGTFTLTTRDSEIVLTERELAWLCDISGPAHLVHRRAAAGQEAAAA